MNKHRVVITGLGPISPIGIGKENYQKALREGKSGVRRITSFNVEDYSSQIAGICDFDPLNYLTAKEIKRMDRFIQFAVAATMLAIEDSGMNLSSIDPCRVGVNVGSGIGGLLTLEENHKKLLEKGPRRISPFLIPMMICDMASGQIAIKFGAKGPNTCIVTACASGAHAIGDAFRTIQNGFASVMITGASEAPITPLGLAGFCSMGALSTRNAEPKKASRPFDRERDGFVIAEGAGVLILEEESHARHRDAFIYAEIVGYGATCDAYHITAPAPRGEGAAAAMREALADAGISPDEVDYINAHGTSTPLNDKLETEAIKSVFGEHAYRIPVSSTKSMLGHTLAASGALELIACCLSIKEGVIYPTINYQYPDKDCDLDYVPNVPRQAKVDVCLSNSFGFGGHNASLIIKRYEG